MDDAGFRTHEPTTLGPLTMETRTMETVQGATYYVQVGGFAAQYGRLRLSAIAG